MDAVTLDIGEDTKAVIHKFGATITSWKVKGQELIFVSPKAIFDGKKAIRGGVPICWPSFGPWSEGPQHGFARVSQWQVKEGSLTNSSVTLVLDSSESWSQKFQLLYTVTLGDSNLDIKLEAVNKNTEGDFQFTTALHTYFNVPHVENVSIDGLKGLSYVDKTLEGIPTVTEERESVKLAGWTDRVYLSTPDTLTLNNVSPSGGKIKFSKTNLPDAVVWNPWDEKAGGMGDLGAENWPGFICVEAGQCVTPVNLAPGQSWSAGHRLEFSQ